MNWLDILKGAGSILQAGATYYNGKQQSKMAKEEFDYMKERDKLTDKKTDSVESNLDLAIDNVYNKKKKTDATTTSTTSPSLDLSMSYGA